jgi:hypothetical protein
VCDTEPPTLSSKITMSLGKEFCQISYDKLSNDMLKRKQKKALGSSVKQGGKAPKTKANEDDGKPTKKKSKKN